MSVAFEFEEEVALVTGASGALAGAVAETFADAGATVAGVSRSEPDGFPGTFHAADLTEEAAAERAVADVVAEHGGIDHLLNVAGAWRGGTPVEDTPVEEFAFVLDVNLRTAFLTTKHALPHLQEAAGTVVNVAAKTSFTGGEGDAPYRAAKAGLRLFTESVAAENEGVVRANAVAPRVIDTPANREAMPNADFDDWATPAEIAATMAFLCSDGASATTGAVVPVYGN